MLYIFHALLWDTFTSDVVEATAIIVGSIVGGICSWIVTKKSMYRTERIQLQLADESRKFEEKSILKQVCESASIIRLDICTAMFQTVRSLKSARNNLHDFKAYLIPIPINRDYSSAVASMGSHFELKELSYLYQLYGIIEKLNNDIKNFKYNGKEECNLLIIDYEILLRKLFGDEYVKIVEFDIDRVTYRQLYDNDYMKSGYRSVLVKLDTICEKGSAC